MNIFKKKKIKKDNVVSYTFSEICGLMGIPIPTGYENLADYKVSKVTLDARFAVEGSVVFLLGKKNRMERMLKAAKDNKAAIVFVDSQQYEDNSCHISDVPIAQINHLIDHIENYYNSFRNAYKGKVIGITGSLGKSTTKQYIECILASEKAFISAENFNSYNIVGSNVVNKMKEDSDLFIQEVGAGGYGTVELSSSILKPDIAIITNVRPHHLNNYKSIENIFHDKIQLAENVRNGGVAIINCDDDLLCTHNYKCDVISYGINTKKNVDFRAVNIIQDGELLTMDIVCKTHKIHVKSNIYGKHNAYNILAAFALCSYLGKEEDAIIQGISRYRTKGIRQNMKKHGNNVFFMDCYNVSNDSIIAAMETFEEFKIDGDGRKIAIIGGENKLGKNVENMTRELGEQLKYRDVSEIVCVGTNDRSLVALNKFGDCKTLYDTIHKSGFKNVKLCTSMEQLCEYLKNTIKDGDAVLCKGIYWLNLAVAIDKVFGTDFTFELRYIKDQSRQYKLKGGITVRNIYGMNQLLVIDCINAKTIRNLTIQDSYNGHEIFGINSGLFYNNKRIKNIDFGNTIKVLGSGSFEGCTNIKKIIIPDSMMSIMDRAFYGCNSLESIRIGRRVRHIGKDAFGMCSSLEEVEAHSSLKTYIENIFNESVSIRYYD